MERLWGNNCSKARKEEATKVKNGTNGAAPKHEHYDVPIGVDSVELSSYFTNSSFQNDLPAQDDYNEYKEYN